MDFFHQPVLFEEVLEHLAIKAGGVYVDGTLGGAGHALGILQRLGPQGKMIALDRDSFALEHARQRLGQFGRQVELFKENFGNMEAMLHLAGFGKVDGILLDLGVSSPQIDHTERGFSYMLSGPLDMRMDQSAEKSARDLVNELPAKELENIIREFGEERWAKRISAFILEEREKEAIETTGHLVTVIKKAIPVGAREKGSHPAKRTFQALRIAVNGELQNLKSFLEQAPRLLNPGGRLVMITFHSLEDRMVKESFRAFTRNCICPPGQPICTCKVEPLLRVITKKPIVASGKEQESNPRSRSAKLRAAERI